ncbi:NAD-dependent epimerase/dehydratase family protein [Pseudonocardia halophobica]|uniref:NAD-dependent epimerase/dehydratase family protein n=1 Tax=Pseudonocardia halophobica TaxID=29401 RepID=UPI003D8FB478
MSGARRVLVAGASGLVGEAAVESFAEAGWEVVALSRRPPARSVRHLAVDLTDAAATAEAVADLRPSHLVYGALHEKPGLIRGWREQDQMRTNLAMFRALLDPLAPGLEHVTLLQGTKAYGVHLHPIPVPARERSPRDPHENFYWLQEDHLRASAAAHGFAWTILRPQIVVGPTTGVAMNLPPVIGVYAAVRRELGLPFGYPGGAGIASEAVDVRLVGDAALWAATAETARDQHFNLTNGEAFNWRDLWPALADELGMAPAPDEPVRLAEYLPAHADVWRRIAEREGLVEPSLDALLGESHFYADYCFAHGATEARPPALVSTVKVRQAGFGDCYDTEESFRHWMRVLRERKVLPA